jgi:hypothetical protein
MQKIVATVALVFLASVALAVAGTSSAPRAVLSGPQIPVNLQRLLNKSAPPAAKRLAVSPGQGQGQKDAAGGPDGYGYIYKDETESGGPSYNWIDISGATNSGITGDDSYGTVSIPFTFRYYGQSYTTCYPGTNGMLGLSGGSTVYSNSTLPSTSLPAACPAPYWDDLYVDGSSGIIYYKTTGSSPNRQFTVIWDSVYTLSGSYRLVFEAILSEADSSVTFQYKYVSGGDSGSSATVGQQGATSGSNYLQYSYLTNSLKSGRAIKFWIPGQVAHDVTVSSLLAPAGMMDSGTSVTPACSVANVGQNTESYTVRMKIGSGYNQTASVSNHPAGTKVYVTFPSWTATPVGTIAVSCSTQLTGDGNNANDKKTGTVTVSRAGAFKVLVVAAEAMTSYPYLQNAIRDSSGGAIVSADWFDPRSTDLRRPDSLLAAGYKAILTFTDYTYYNATDLGDTLAKFMELGGGVVLQVFADNPSWGIAGRYASQYLPIVQSGTDYGSCSMGTIYAPTHPVMQGVSTITSGEYNTSSTTIAHAAHTTRLADWNVGGYVQSAAYDSAGKRTVFLGFFPVQEIGNYLSGQWVRQIVNALVWSTNPSVANDVGVTRIVAPGAAVDSGATVTPACSTYNFGTATQTYKVKMQIGSGYTDSATVTSQASHTATYVTFPTWTATVRGSQAIACSTRLAGDQTPSNDKLTGTTNVVVRDMGVTRLLAPPGAVDSGSSVAPACSVYNWGTAAASCSVRVKIGSGYNRATYVTGLASGARGYVTFPSWTATVRGSTAVSCSTELATDMRTSNDKVSSTTLVRVHDLTAVSITVPTGVIMGGVVVTPTATAHNTGNVREACTATFMINAPSPYIQTISLPNGLPYSPDTTLTFPNWTVAGAGSLTAKCSLYVAAEQKPADNVVSQAFTVAAYDIGPTAINAPAGSYDTGVMITPQVTVDNFTTQAVAGAKVVFRIDSTAGNTVYADTLTRGMDASAESTWSFKPWQAIDFPGNYATFCSTYCAGDTKPSNNVITGSFTLMTQPPGWYTKSAMPISPSGKYDQAGGWLAYSSGGDGGGEICAAKGNKTPDFYSYDVATNVWTQKNSWPNGSEGKAPKAGAIGCSDGNGHFYTTKGNNTPGFWMYDASKDSWYEKASVPLGLSNKKVKGGTGIVWAYNGSTGSPYLLKGYKNEFYRYDVATDAWVTLPPAPIGSNQKWDKGSWVAYDDVNKKIYAFKAKVHEFYRYSPDGDSWSAALNPMPIPGSAGSKKAKDGSCAAFLGGNIYALKGGNTTEFWCYTIATNTWTEKETIPQVAPGGKKKKVKSGAGMVSTGTVLYAMKGNKSNEVWQYVTGGFLFQMPDRGGVMANQSAIGDCRMAISPNPLANGFATLRYSLPRAGAIQLRVYDVTGRTVMYQALNVARNGAATLNLRHLSNGVYLVKLSSDSFSVSRKLVVQR